MSEPSDSAAAVARVADAFRRANLSTVWDHLRDQYPLDRGAYFDHPLALPVVALPRWAAGPHQAGVAEAQAAAVAGYLHARLLDDRLDADTARRPHPLGDLAASFALVVHIDLLCEAAGDRSILSTATERWGAFARAMADELDTRDRSGGLSTAEHDRSLDRSRAMVLPALAIRRRYGLAEAPVVAVVDHLVDAHQRLTDVLDLQRDANHGLRTLAWHALGLADGPTAPFSGGRLDRWFADIAALHDRVSVHEAGLPGLGPWLRARRAHAEDVQAGLWQSYLKAWLTGESPPA